MAFYPLEGATQSPESYRNSLYIALHGAGNSSLLAGYYSLSHVEDFLTGWLNRNGTSSGRPIGITFAPGGSMVISDDQAGLIYHVWYQASPSVLRGPKLSRL